MNKRRDNHLWLKMWSNQQTDDFHQLSINTLLMRFWPELNIPQGKRVFVPLCGKSLDILWLADNGYEVIGVELSPLAVSAFFSENNLKPVKRQLTDFTLWTHGNISILCGDYFSLSKAQLGDIDTVYDRAALTALPEDIRSLYVSHLHTIVSGNTNIFLLTIEDTEDNQHLQLSQQVDEELISLYDRNFKIELKYIETFSEERESEPTTDSLLASYKVYHLRAR